MGKTRTTLRSKTHALRLTKRSHHFLLTDIDSEVMKIILEYARTLIQWGRFRKGNYTVKTAMKVFAAATKDRTEFRFHINYLPDFLRLLKQKGYSSDTDIVSKKVLVEEEEIVRGADTSVVKIMDHFVPRPDQVGALKYLQDIGPGKRAKLLALRTGAGKAQPLDAKIRVPGGWSTMGEMQVGTEVIAADGTTTHVTEIHPQGKEKVYRITFFDGRQVECSGDHLWRIYHSQDRGYWKVITTKELILKRRFRKNRHFVQLVTPENGPDLDLPIDPYLLGALLGDGYLGESIGICNPEKEIMDRVRAAVPEGVEVIERRPMHYVLSRTNPALPNPLKTKIKSLGLDGTRSNNKFIPKEYFQGSLHQRLEILRGLLDTDGYAGLHGTITYTSVSKQLAEDVQALVWSVGGIAKISMLQKYYTGTDGEKKPGQPSYNVNIRHTKPTELFHLRRKKARVSDANQYAATMKLRIEDTEEIGEKETQCITIAHPDHLYVTDGFVVTHNSLVAMMAAAQLGKRNVYLMRPAFIDNWIKNFNKTYVNGTDGCVIVQGRKQLQALLQLAVDGDLNYDNIVISNKTFQYWLKDYEDQGMKILDMGWPAIPDKFTETLGADILTIDELHLDFHLNYKIFLYTHVNVSFAMTATLETRDPFLSSVYERVQPFRDRYQSKKVNLYIDAFAYMYQFENMNNVQISEYGSDDYSHNAFERWIMRDKDRLEAYFRMIGGLIETDYLQIRDEGESALIFCSSVKMCQLLSEWLAKRHPQETVEYFIAGGDYTENFLNASIVVSTTGKAGTAVDKEGLRTTILTISIDSIASNLQILGRLREMPSGNTPRFIYLVCKDIDKHIKYHQNKLELFPKYVKSIRTRSHHEPL